MTSTILKLLGTWAQYDINDSQICGCVVTNGNNFSTFFSLIGVYVGLFGFVLFESVTTVLILRYTGNRRYVIGAYEGRQIVIM